MIQRIQSVFLFLLVLSMVAMLFLPLWSKTDPATNQTLILTAWNLKPEQAQGDAAASLPSQGTFAIGMLAIAAAVLALYEIFQFKNRLNQMKMGLLNTLVLAALLGTTFYYAMYVGNDMIQASNPGEYEPGFYMPILALLLNALANRFIRRDENLVRSVDRLR
ncbi:DUF4293 domain-containing protein [Pontibacter vulgaris]|uniref:DUF4293 domain-containing protein n=1 Tax=Pontibacter vulgaris TaxID=2905679 RepID=UPI001FA80FAF|nr:DUF4293 domain-containing protein [Pontibacter vulgaris]